MLKVNQRPQLLLRQVSVYVHATTQKKIIASLLKRTALSHDGTMRLDVRNSKVTFSQLKTRKFVTTRFACQNAVHLNSELIYNYIFS